MAITEESRQDLFQLFESTYGREGALLIMEYLPPVGWADVATKRDLDAQTVLLSRDIAAVRQDLSRDIAAVRQDLSRDIAAMRKDLSQDIAAVRQESVAMGERLSAEIEGAKHELRAEIAGLEVRMLNAFGSQTRAMVIGLILALVGMVATAVGLG